jgi:L-threonylcarbamoyladenylate synthase
MTGTILVVGADPPPAASAAVADALRPLAAPADARPLAAAADALRSGLVIGLPTDTVYGLAVDPSRVGAVERIFASKQRPRSVALPVLVADVDQVAELCGTVPREARLLMDRYWPGPLTVVIPRAGSDRGGGPDLGGDGLTIGVRRPAHAVAVALCRSVGPLAVTSANQHGQPAALDAATVADLPGVALTLDAGRCSGAPSTVIDCSVPGRARVLREGGVPAEEIARFLETWR